MSAPPPYAPPGQAQPGQFGQPNQSQPGQFGQPIQTQPGQAPVGQMNGIQPIVTMASGGAAVVWMPRPVAKNPGVIPGLEYLDVLHEIIFKQKLDVFEAMTGIDRINKYSILDPHTGWQVGLVVEDSAFCERCCCKSNRSFVAKVTDSQGYVMFTMTRPLQCPCNPIPCLPCWNLGGTETSCMGNSIAINAGDGTKIGSVTLNSGCGFPCGVLYFTVRDEAGNAMYRLGNNKCDTLCGVGGGGMCGDKVFYLEDMQGRRLDTYTKIWRGFGEEAFTNADTFKVTFLPTMTANHKATMIAAVLLFDFNLFEKAKEQ